MASLSKTIRTSLGDYTTCTYSACACDRLQNGDRHAHKCDDTARVSCHNYIMDIKSIPVKVAFVSSGVLYVTLNVRYDMREKRRVCHIAPIRQTHRWTQLSAQLR